VIWKSITFQLTFPDSIETVPPTQRFHWEPVSLSHRLGFARHSYDETKRGNVTDAMSSKKGSCMLDVTTEWGQHAEQRLRSNMIAWLTTVGSDGRPYTVPIWFLWDGNTVLIFSQPQKQKIRNLRNNARVTLALDDTKQGEDVVIVEGTADVGFCNS
jgi:hypothetical protein